MKQTDVAMLILIVSISLLVSYFVGNALFGGDGTRDTQVEKVNVLDSDFVQPDPLIFNDDAVNLVQTINIGDTSETDPFKSTTD